MQNNKTLKVANYMSLWYVPFWNIPPIS